MGWNHQLVTSGFIWWGLKPKFLSVFTSKIYHIYTLLYVFRYTAGLCLWWAVMSSWDDHFPDPKGSEQRMKNNTVGGGLHQPASQPTPPQTYPPQKQGFNKANKHWLPLIRPASKPWGTSGVGWPVMILAKKPKEKEVELPGSFTESPPEYVSSQTHRINGTGIFTYWFTIRKQLFM